MSVERADLIDTAPARTIATRATSAYLFGVVVAAFEMMLDHPRA